MASTLTPRSLRVLSGDVNREIRDLVSNILKAALKLGPSATRLALSRYRFRKNWGSACAFACLLWDGVYWQAN
jgi:hypothetical protein